MTPGRVSAALLGAALLVAPAALAAQHEHPMPAPAPKDTAAHAMRMPGMRMAADPLGVPMTRMGSGTSWVPDVSPMHAYHFMAGGWEMMLHGVVFAQYDRQNGPRGDDQFGSVNWGMLMASRELAGGRFQLHGMLSAEPFTVGAEGYPLLLQTGESYRGRPLHDRQHPHDLFMELAALYERPVSQNLGVQLYVAPVGEPAIGPVAFPHRPSASNDPFAPLGHHWQDATHITFGVVTAGIFSRTWKLEGSVFNGREPDEERTDFDFRRLDSYSGRFTYNPGPNWSFSASAAHLESPEALHPDESTQRLALTAMHGRAFGPAGNWSSAVGLGANRHTGGGGVEPSIFAESNLELDARNAVFGRVEYVRKNGEELVLDEGAHDREFGVGSLAAGYVREVANVGPFSAGIGGRFAVNLVPEALKPYYGSRTPTGGSVYLRLRARATGHEAMAMEHAHAVPPMEHHPPTGEHSHP